MSSSDGPAERAATEPLQFAAVIPARYGSSRLPGKPLLEIEGRPLIEHVYRAVCRSGADRVAVATDDERIETCCRQFGAETVRTRADHPTGTDRLAEVATVWDLPDAAIVVNCQGDEPLLPPSLPREVAQALLNDPDARIATAAEPLESAAELFESGAVKVVRDGRGRALYFSRAPIPWFRDAFTEGPADAIPDSAGDGWLRHIGLYAYRAGFLRQYPDLEPVAIEALEQLEQLRALWHGFPIQVTVTGHSPGPGVDTLADLERVRTALRAGGSAPEAG